MRKLKARYVWLIIVVLMVLAFLLVYGCTKVTGTGNTVLIVLLAIDFIAMTILVQVASAKTFKFKPKKRSYDELVVSTNADIKTKLNKLKYSERITPFGYSYLSIINKSAVKVSIIENAELYFNPKEEDKPKPNHSLDNCERFIGFEIFMSIDEKNIDKLVDFSIQGKNVYYTAFYYNEDNHNYKCFNYVKPNELFEEGYNKLFNDLGFSINDK